MSRSVPMLSAVVALLACGSAAHAQLIVSDGFNYTPGAITNASGGNGWPADGGHNWFTSGGTTANQVTAGGLTFAAGGNALATTGGKLTTSGGDAAAFRNLPTTSGVYGGSANQTLWISFLASNTSSTNQSGYAGLSLINAYTSGGVYTQTANFFIGQVSGTGRYGFRNDMPSGSNPAAFLADVTTDTNTHFLVVRLDFTASGSTEVSLYVDPTPGVAPTGTPQAQEDYTSGFVFNQVRFQSGSAAAATYNFDELRMGSTYADVAPVGTKVTGTVSLQGVQAGHMAQPLTFTLTPTGGTNGAVTTQTLTPAADGTFTLANVSAGTYTLGVKGSKWLKRDVALNTTGGNVSGISVSLLGGDLDGNNVVDLNDFLILRGQFNMIGANLSADIDCNGQVDLNDFLILRANFNATGDP